MAKPKRHTGKQPEIAIKASGQFFDFVENFDWDALEVRPKKDGGPSGFDVLRVLIVRYTRSEGTQNVILETLRIAELEGRPIWKGLRFRAIFKDILILEWQKRLGFTNDSLAKTASMGADSINSMPKNDLPPLTVAYTGGAK